MRFPPNMGFGAKPIIHAIEWDTHQTQPPNLITTRMEEGMGEKLGLTSPESEEAIGSMTLDLSGFMLDDIAQFM